MPPKETKSMERDIGKLEKGVENLETGVRDMRRDFEASVRDIRQDQSDQYREMMNSMKEMHLKFDEFKDSSAKDLVSMRLRFQRLSMTVAAIISVSVLILKGVFDATKDAIAQSLFGH